MAISHHPKSQKGIRHNLTFLAFTILGAIVPRDTDLSMQDFILYFNTAIRSEKLANTEIPCQKSTKYRYRIDDRSRLLLSKRKKKKKSCIYLACLFTLNMRAPEINLRRRKKAWEDLDRYNDRKARSLDTLPISS